MKKRIEENVKKEAFAVFCANIFVPNNEQNGEKQVICWYWKIAMENGRLSVHSFFLCCIPFDVMYL